MSIRGFDWIIYGDDTDRDQQLIESISLDKDERYVTLHFTDGVDLQNVIRSIQSNDSLFAQVTEGLYQIDYLCPFRFLVPEAAAITCITLGLKSVKFYPDVFTDG